MNYHLASLLALVALLSAVMLLNSKGKNVFRFPFLFASVWLAFLLYQFGSFLASGSELVSFYNSTGALDAAVILLYSCAILALSGYWIARSRMAGIRRPPAESLRRSQVRALNVKAGLIGLISLASYGYLSVIGGGPKAFFLEGGNYEILYRGLPVYLIFVARFIYFSIAVYLHIWSVTGRRFYLYLAAFFSMVPALNILFLFRRSEVIILGVMWGFFLLKRGKVNITPRKSLAAVLAMIFVMAVFPLLREQGISGLENVSFDSFLYQPQGSWVTTEIASALFRINSIIQNDTFQYGLIFWDALIKQFVPAGLVGNDFKESLLMLSNGEGFSGSADFRFYLSPVAFAQVYQQFWHFGALIFAGLGALAAKFEFYRKDSARGEIFLVLMLPVILSSVSADVTFIVSRIITYGALTLFLVPRQGRCDRGEHPYRDLSQVSVRQYCRADTEPRR